MRASFGESGFLAKVIYCIRQNGVLYFKATYTRMLLLLLLLLTLLLTLLVLTLLQKTLTSTVHTRFPPHTLFLANKDKAAR